MLVNVDEECYSGCYYYSDSCFRKDCKLAHGMNETLTRLSAEVKKSNKLIQKDIELMEESRTTDVKMIQKPGKRIYGNMLRREQSRKT